MQPANQPPILPEPSATVMVAPAVVPVSVKAHVVTDHARESFELLTQLLSLNCVTVKTTRNSRLHHRSAQDYLITIQQPIIINGDPKTIRRILHIIDPKIGNGVEITGEIAIGKEIKEQAGDVEGKFRIPKEDTETKGKILITKYTHNPAYACALANKISELISTLGIEKGLGNNANRNRLFVKPDNNSVIKNILKYYAGRCEDRARAALSPG